MTEQTNPQDKFMSRLNVAVAIIVAVIALLGSFITKIENDASALSSAASNEEQGYYYDAIGNEINGAADVNYSFGTVYQLWYQYNVQLTAARKHNDKHAVQTFTELRDSVAKTSALFDSKYFNAETGQVDLMRYRSDRYSTLVYTLQEKQQAAADVSSAWGEKSSIYILQLTLLAVAGFLLGLALMSQSKIPSLIFAISGIALVAIITVWAYIVYQTPVFDLRQTKAITNFAEGSSLSDQKRWQEALESFTQAIDAASPDHPYGNAYLRRARVHAALGQFESAIQDFQTANQLGNNDPTLNASLVWAYFQTGDFSNAITAGTEAIKYSPDDLWLQQQLNMAILASGDNQKASQQYQDWLDQATQQVDKQRKLGKTPSEIWWLIDEAAFQLDQMVNLLKNDVASPIKAHIGDPETVSKTAQELADLLRARALGLQYNITETSASSAATVDNLGFELLETDDELYVYKVNMQFSYSAFETGQLLTFKVYRNGIQDPSWSFNQRWSGEKTTGQSNFTISPTYSSMYIVPPGLYTVDIYMNGQVLRRGEFAVSDPNNPVAGEEPESLVMEDMLDQFDFFAEDFAFSDTGDIYFDYLIFLLNSDEGYFTTFDQAYDFNTEGCTDPNDLTCITIAIDCTANPDDPSCEAPASVACESDPTLSADDPNCASSTSQVCASDPALSANDPNCTSSTSQTCASDPTLSADDPNCTSSTSQACESDPSLSADDPNCAASTSQVCESDSSLSADDPNCTAVQSTAEPVIESTEAPTDQPTEEPPTDEP